jgi:hypothetical protein
MTEDILNAAIQKLRAMALEQYALIKNAVHNPATPETVTTISSCAVNLAQLEGAMITLQQYSPTILALTDAEKLATAAVEQPEPEEPPPEETVITDKDLADRSSSFRKSQGLKPNVSKPKPKKGKK